MTKHMLLRVLGLIMVLMGGVGVSVAQTAKDTVIVNTAEDVETGCPDVCSLREAVAIVADGGTISFSDDFLYAVVQDTPIVINRDMTIIGHEGVALEASRERSTKLLIVNDAEVLIQDLNLRGATSSDSGGAIENHGTLTLERTFFQGNLSHGDGGAIYNTGTLVVRDSAFSGNMAENGGAITSFETNATTITGSSFLWNIATSDGGALYGDYGGLVVINSVFESNRANRGGAILMDGFLERGIVANSTIYRNEADYGGGLCNIDEDSLFMLTSNIIAGNKAADIPDVCELMTSGGHNLVGDSSFGRWVATDLLDQEPKLGIWEDPFGFLLRFFALDDSSPAIGMGDCAGNAAAFIPAVTTDQRGVERKIPCDIGAFETESATN